MFKAHLLQAYHLLVQPHGTQDAVHFCAVMRYISLSRLTNHCSVKEFFVASETVASVAQLDKGGSSLLKTSWPMPIAVTSLDVS